MQRFNVAKIKLLRSQESASRRRNFCTQVSSNVKLPIQRQVVIPLDKHKEGDTIHNFELLKIRNKPEFNITTYSLKHKVSDLMLHHFDSIDTNNSMAFHFNTPAFNSTGIFHILEHLTLAGSKRYKERDPFFKMLKRSLKTYMNAWTGNDFTMYPFSTTNYEDYQNLRQVYYNSVFHPRLDYLDFLQEGWRLEPLTQEVMTVGNKRLELVFNGVVLNEMKGEMIKPDSQFIMAVYKHLFEGSYYQNNSGGDPNHITDLTYQDILNSHAKYYCFENCSVFSYGDFGINNNLEFFNENIMVDCLGKPKRSISEDFIVKTLKPFSSSKHVIEYYQPDLSEEVELDDLNKHRFETEEEQSKRLKALEENNETWKFAISYCMNQTTAGDKYISQTIPNYDAEYLTFKLTVLSQLLMDGPNSPFYKRFLETELAPAYIHGYGYSSDLKYGVMTIGFMGFKASNSVLDKIEKGILETLYEVSKTGFPESQIKEILHLLEYEFMKPKEDFGINIYERSSSFFTHSKNPTAVLELPNFIYKLKRELAEKKKIFEELIELHLLNNNHRVHITLKPKKNLTIIENEKEAQRLIQIESKLTSNERLRIATDNKDLIEAQNQEDKGQIQKINVGTSNELTNASHSDLTVLPLPSLPLSAIPPSVEMIRQVKAKAAYDVPLTFFPQNTNSLSFIRIKANLKNVPTKYKSYVNLYSYLLPRVGTKSIPYKEFQNKFNTNSSGLSINLYTDVSIGSNIDYIEELVYEVSFLNSNIETALNLFEQLIAEPDFLDIVNLNNLIKQKSIDLANDLSENELRYAQEYAAAGLRPNKLVYNEFIQALEMMKLGSEILKTSDPKKAMKHVIENLLLIHNLIFNKHNLCFSVHGDKRHLGQIESKLSLMLNALKNSNPIFNHELLENHDFRNFDNLEEEISKFNDIELMSNNTSDINLNNAVSNIKPNTNLSILLEDSNERLALAIGKKQVIQTPSNISNCAESFIVPNYLNDDLPKLLVAGNLIALVHLHKEIREKGGAYGSGVKFNSGICTFWSYRDPNPHKTYKHFEQGVIKISKGRFSETDLHEVKLYIFGDLDRVIPPQDKGLDTLIKGVSAEHKNHFRQVIINATREEIIDVANRYFVSQMEKGTTSRVLFGNITQNGLNEADDYFKSNNWEFIENMKFLGDEYFKEKEDNN